MDLHRRQHKMRVKNRFRDKEDNMFTIAGEKGEDGGLSILKEIITDNFSELMNNINPQIQESQ